MNYPVLPSIKILSRAKINLSLRILGKRSDQFHELKTFMVPLELSDELEISKIDQDDLSFTCDNKDIAQGEDNLCIKAARFFFKVIEKKPNVLIRLKKNIPYGAGLGGGSSNAATVLKVLNQLFNFPLNYQELYPLAATIGSDVPFFLQNSAAWCTGRGEIVTPVHLSEQRDLLIISPPFTVASSWAYKEYARLGEKKSETQWLGNIEIVNDLEAPVFQKNLILPILKKWLCEQKEVEVAFMTGSGSTTVAIFKESTSIHQQDNLNQKIISEFGSTFLVKSTKFYSPKD